MVKGSALFRIAGKQPVEEDRRDIPVRLGNAPAIGPNFAGEIDLTKFTTVPLLISGPLFQSAKCRLPVDRANTARGF